MANRKKEVISLVNKKIGCNPDGSPRLVFEKDQPIEGLTPKQIKYYKQIKYIE